jgi:hypothetical protein
MLAVTARGKHDVADMHGVKVARLVLGEERGRAEGRIVAVIFEHDEDVEGLEVNDAARPKVARSHGRGDDPTGTSGAPSPDDGVAVEARSRHHGCTGRPPR